MRKFSIRLSQWLIAFACLSGSVFVSAHEAIQRPNILLILADDLGVNDIGAWGDGVAPTPNLDQLSQQAIRFRRHYTDSTCSVSRAALLTGRAPVNIGFEPIGLGLSPDLENLPKSLKQLGYRTHHVGKWHVGEAIEYPDVWPYRQGFDDWFGMFSHFVLQGPDESGAPRQNPPTYYNPWLQENEGPPRQYMGHLDDLLADRAITLVEQAEKHKPWFINLWLLAPHHPVQPSDVFKQQFPATPEGSYLALLKQLDHNVARVLQALKDSGQWDNTIVVFGSDNGSPNMARNSNFPLVGTKANYLEGGVRTPLLIRWPGQRGDVDIQAVTHITDIYPTLLGMVRGDEPAGLDGVNLAGLMASGEALADRPLYWAADVKTWGMSYAAHLPSQGLFYRDLFGRLQVPMLTGPLAADPPVAAVQGSFSKHQASQLIREWEKQRRPLPLQWNPDTAELSGRDYQRAPVFGSYSMGLALELRGGEAEEQTIVEQAGVWKLALNTQGHVQMTHGESRLEGPRLALRPGCNSLVASFNLKPKSRFPFLSDAESIFALYLNGRQVMGSEELLSRPVDPSVLANPTKVGASVDASMPFMAVVSRPVVVGKYLLPEQEGYSLRDMQEAVCPSL